MNVTVYYIVGGGIQRFESDGVLSAGAILSHLHWLATNGVMRCEPTYTLLPLDYLTQRLREISR